MFAVVLVNSINTKTNKTSQINCERAKKLRHKVLIFCVCEINLCDDFVQTVRHSLSCYVSRLFYIYVCLFCEFFLFCLCRMTKTLNNWLKFGCGNRFAQLNSNQLNPLRRLLNSGLSPFLYVMLSCRMLLHEAIAGARRSRIRLANNSTSSTVSIVVFMLFDHSLSTESIDISQNLVEHDDTSSWKSVRLHKPRRTNFGNRNCSSENSRTKRRYAVDSVWAIFG